MCLKKRRLNDNGEPLYCKKKAHRTGRCEKHCANNVGHPIVHGAYSTYLNEKYSDRYEKFLKDPNLLELRDEVALLRVVTVRINEVLDEIQERYRKRKYKSDDNLKEEIDMLNKLSDNIEKISRTVEKARKSGEGMLPIEALDLCLKQIVYMINFNIGQCPKCHNDLSPVKAQLFKEMQELKVPDAEVK